ncbi:unnamed protein product [Colias eurytheme]|nr:unnamed protein product [Colias eurytheme]
MLKKLFVVLLLAVMFIGAFAKPADSSTGPASIPSTIPAVTTPSLPATPSPSKPAGFFVPFMNAAENVMEKMTHWTDII